MINTVLAIIWCLIKLAFIAVSAILAIVLIIAVLHPIVIDGKVRTTQKGQKVYLNLSYLFNTLGVEFEASPNANRTYFRLLSRRKLIDKQDRVKTSTSKNVEDMPEKNNVEVVSSVPEVDTTTENIKEDDYRDYNAKDETIVSSETDIKKENVVDNVQQEEKKIENVTEVIEPQAETKSDNQSDYKADLQTESKPEAKTEEVIVEKPTENASDNETGSQSEAFVNEIHIEKTTDNVSNSESSSQVETVATEINSVKTDEIVSVKESKSEDNTVLEKEHVKIDLPKDIPIKEEGFFEKIRRLLKKFKRDVNRRLDQLKGKIRIFRRHWRICKPAAKRLWKRIKSFVELKNINLLVRYALPKPHLTGMLYGSVAGFFDLFRRFGVEFSLIPVFTGASQTFYLKLGGRIVLRPFWIIWALFCLLFEFSLYKEYYELYKFIKSRRGKKK